MEYQLALEGGGAKGAYQVGVVKALLENGYVFNAVTGTSIGALNGVMIAQNKFDGLYKVWKEMKVSNLFVFDDEYAEKIANNKFNPNTVKYLLKSLRQQFKSGGINTTKIRHLINEHVDEDVLRNSGIDFGVMTVNISKFESKPVFVKDMPSNTVADFVMASANFPGFGKVMIDNHSYRDGGMYDNLPINMLLDKGYKNIIAIKTGAIAPTKKVKNKNNAKIDYIVPSEKPGRLLDFTPESVNRGLKVGYYDGLRYINKYDGIMYYFIDAKDLVIRYNIYALPISTCHKIEEILDLKNDDNDRIFRIINILKRLKKLLSIEEKNSDSIIVGLLEEIARIAEINRLQVLSVDTLISMIKDNYHIIGKKKEEDKLSKKQIVLERVFASLIF